MTKRIIAAGMAIVMLLSLCGCGSLFEAEYYYSRQFKTDTSESRGGEVEISNYNMLKAAIIELISNAEEHGEFRISNYRGTVQDDLAAACQEIEIENPIGAYAVEDISYDTSRIVSYYIAEINVKYKRTAEEIDAIVNLGSAPELHDYMQKALGQRLTRMTLKIYSSVINEEYITRQIRETYFSDPAGMPVEPDIKVRSFPESGANRIYDVELDYGSSTSNLNFMAVGLKEAVSSLASSVEELDPANAALTLTYQLSALSSAGNGEAGDHPDSAYGPLVEGSGNSKGIALAFKALCNELGIECLVAEGSSSGNYAAIHYWNILNIDGDYYHVDISCFAEDPERAFLVSDSLFWGDHIWLPEDYPQCSGELTYWDFVEKPQEERESEATEIEDGSEPTAEPETENEKTENNA